MSENPRFIADVMLGSLAKWLRLLGFDTLYSRSMDDNDLVRIAKQQGRVLLTRDQPLAKSRKAGNAVLVHSEDTFRQVKEVLEYLKAAGHTALPGRPRCAECNGELSPAGRESVADEVPEHVLLNRDSFFRCGDCGKVYWDGTHRKAIYEKMREILGEAGWLTSERD